MKLISFDYLESILTVSLALPLTLEEKEIFLDFIIWSKRMGITVHVVNEY